LQGKSIYAILLSIITILALALAVLVIFILTTYNSVKKPSPEASDTPTQQAREVPADEEVRFNLYTDEDGRSTNAIFNIKSSPAHEGSFLMASIIVVYDGGPKKTPKEQETRKELIENYKSEMREACIEYFKSLTYEELNEDSAMDRARDTLKDEFNRILSGKTKDKLILRVVFDKWILQ
jgi:flagellar basal body-associated protein FliL